MKQEIVRILEEILKHTDPEMATFDQLAEEVLELHLSLRKKHNDPPEIEWLAIATISINALSRCNPKNVVDAYLLWMTRHGKNIMPE